MSWPDGGPWVVAATSTNANWAVAAAALCAASGARTAVLRILDGAQCSGAPDETVEPGRGGATPHGLLHDNAGTYVEVRAGGIDALSMDDVVGLVQTLTRTHGLVLVGGHGLAVPLGRDGWTLADLAWALRAPVVLVADPGSDAVNHTTLAIEVLAGRGLAATVVAVGAGEDLDVLPVALAGRIPSDAADQPELFRAAAAGWLDPLLHATRDRPASGAGPTAAAATAGGPSAAAATAGGPGAAGGPTVGGPGAAGGPTGGSVTAKSTVSGKRVLVVLFGIFLVLLMALCGLTLSGGGPTGTTVTTGIAQVRVSPAPAPVGVGTGYPVPTDHVVPRPVPGTLRSRPPATAACPQRAGNVVATEPDAATTARVNAAWSRIERWLAGHAPKTRASLRPPAPRARIAALQTRMSVALPPDLVASLRRHDGTTAVDGFVLPPFYRLLTLDEMAGDREVNCSVLAEGWLNRDWWHPAFVPFASDGGGGSLLVDQRPGGHGRVGRFYPEDGTGFDDWPASIADLLEGVARSLETGQPYARRYRPAIADGSLDWTIETPR